MNVGSLEIAWCTTYLHVKSEVRQCLCDEMKGGEWPLRNIGLWLTLSALDILVHDSYPEQIE